MEKLQNALSKARQKRSSVEDTAPRRVATAGLIRTKKAATPVARASDEAWGSLKEFKPELSFLERQLVTTLNPTRKSNPFDMLRTKVFLMMQQNGWKRLAITSPNPSCGKTTISCNLAVSFSRQPDVRTMLFDMDLRKPGVSRTLGIKSETGTEDVITGNVDAAEHLVRLRSNVAISSASGRAPDPSQVLLSGKAKDTLDRVQDRFQPAMMIFDFAPLLVTDDTRAFLKNVDCAIIVARAEQTKTPELDVCEREVAEQTNVLGIVLNGSRYDENKEEYYYGN